jgi:hypothetical protein
MNPAVQKATETLNQAISDARRGISMVDKADNFSFPSSFFGEIQALLSAFFGR